MYASSKKEIEKEIKSKFKAASDLKMLKDGGFWWFVLNSSSEFESIELLSSATALEQLSISQWISEFKLRYKQKFAVEPALKEFHNVNRKYSGVAPASMCPHDCEK